MSLIIYSINWSKYDEKYSICDLGKMRLICTVLTENLAKANIKEFYFIHFISTFSSLHDSKSVIKQLVITLTRDRITVVHIIYFLHSKCQEIYTIISYFTSTRIHLYMKL